MLRFALFVSHRKKKKCSNGWEECIVANININNNNNNPFSPPFAAQRTSYLSSRFS